MTNEDSTSPTICPDCGGKRIAYASRRTLRFVRQYRRCEDCGATSKTIRWITQKRRLTAAEIEQVKDLLPNGCRSGNGTAGCKVFLIVEKD